MFNYLIFDIDNTIFDYDYSNDQSLSELFDYIKKRESIDKKIIIDRYNKIKKIYQNESGITAASHNKFIQIKKLLEDLHLDINNLDEYSNIYNNSFIKKLKVYNHIENFLIFCNKHNIKLYCLSNNTCKEQIQRLKSTNLLKYFDTIFTSEEFGIEKPDLKLYYSILNKIGCRNDEVAMIGDNFRNDIGNANLINIYGFWFNKKKFKINNNFLEFNDYNVLLNFFKNYYDLSDELIRLSKYVGERFDLVQAGGGNTSFKLNNLMFIKSSGCCLSDLEINKNYVGVDFKLILDNLNITNDNKKEREKKASSICDNSKIFMKNFKPSIETTMHSLTKKYTVHIHPIQFNLISGLDNCDEIIKGIFDNYCFINYFTPGIDVAIEIKKKYNDEDIIFLKNHGIVFTSNNLDYLYNLIKSSIKKLETYLNLDFKKYKFVNKISYEMNNIFKENFVSYLSEDLFINNFINEKLIDEISFKSFFPDKLVYCGNNYLKITDNLNSCIKDYLKKNDEIPKIFIKEVNKVNYLYITSKTIKKNLEIEAVLKAHFYCYNKKNEYLKQKEIDYLNNWDAEKYRKNI